jgi:hypothetical protein
LLGVSQVWGQTTAPGDLKEVLAGTGLTWEVIEEGVDTWRVSYRDGAGTGTIDVYVTYNDDNRRYALIFANVVDEAPEHSYGQDILTECMKLNNLYPGVKFCLDFANGDIDCQNESLMSTLTSKSLSMQLDRVASIADEFGPALRAMSE